MTVWKGGFKLKVSCPCRDLGVVSWGEVNFFFQSSRLFSYTCRQTTSKLSLYEKWATKKEDKYEKKSKNKNQKIKSKKKKKMKIVYILVCDIILWFCNNIHIMCKHMRRNDKIMRIWYIIILCDTMIYYGNCECNT